MTRVGFDLDGVVYDFRAAHSAFEVSRGNTHCSLGRAADHWDYFEGWGQTVDDWLESYAEGVDAGHILWRGAPLPGAVEASGRIKDAGHSIHIVTDRSIGKEPQEATRHWLESVGFQYDTLSFSKDKTSVPTDIFIEDRIENADALNAAGTLCYLINRPWNLRAGDRRPRVDTLEQFVERIHDYSSVMIRRGA